MNLYSYPEIVKKAYLQVLRLLRPVRDYPYHNISHTLDVTGRADRLAIAERLSKEDREDLIIAALFHDTGFTVTYANNEWAWAEIARDWLRTLHYPESRIEKIADIILATVLFSTPKTKAEEIVQDADLDNLGRSDCFIKTAAYCRELRTFSSHPDDKKFFAFSETLFQKFHFHTATSKKERQEKLEENARNFRKIFFEYF